MAKFSNSIIAGSLLFAALCIQARAAMLDPTEIDAARLLPPPPAADTSWAKAEVAELHAIAAASSPAEIEAARRDDADERPDLFNAALGFDVAALPAATKMLNDVLKEEDADSKAAKAYFHRDRPWIVDASIRTCVAVKPGPAANSYPSGHTSLAFSMGVVLAALIPEKAQAILARAEEFGERRLVCGVHFRSDIVAGQQFGTVLALRLMEKPAFKAEMEAARAELRAAHDVN
ncbi:MAG TPA: phosphatase PAP2 family protein [Rhizomicrobium sp.]|jgi:acid phosphatase (class A)